MKRGCDSTGTECDGGGVVVVVVCDSGVTIEVYDMQGCWKAQWSGQEVLRGGEGQVGRMKKLLRVEREKGGKGKKRQTARTKTNSEAVPLANVSIYIFPFSCHLREDISQAQLCGGWKGPDRGADNNQPSRRFFFLYQGHPGTFRPTGQDNGEKDDGQSISPTQSGTLQTGAQKHAHAHKNDDSCTC